MMTGVWMLLLAFSAHFLSAQQTYTETQTAEIKEKTQDALGKVMKMVENRNYGPFLHACIYNGRDPLRNFRSRLNPNDPHDRLYAENLLNRLRHHLKKSALWHNKNFRVVYGYERDLFVWDLEFTSLKGKVKSYQISFIKFKNEYLVARFD